MLELIRRLVLDPFSYVVLLAGGWLLKIFVERLVSGRVNTEFAKQIATHKHELQLAADALRFDYQRQLSDFNLFAVKKHEIAGQVYEKFRIAHGRVRGLTGLSSQLTFEEFNGADISRYMATRNIPMGKQDEVLALWEKDRDAALADLRPYLRMLDIQEADRAFSEAKNAAYSNELYMPNVVIERMNDLINHLAMHLGAVEYPLEPGEKRPSKQELDAALEKLRDTFHAELGGASNFPNKDAQSRG